MNYKNHYEKLITRAKARVLTDYKERHHIVPKCLGGTDDPDNIVNLTAEEHFIAHQLLVKIHPGHSGLSFSALSMCQGNKNMQRSNNKQYAWLRKKHSENISKNQTGKIYWNDGTRSIKLFPHENVPDGFKRGRHFSPTKGTKHNSNRIKNSVFKNKNVQKDLLERRWNKERENICKNFGLSSMEEVKSFLIELKSKQHPRYWVNPILELYPFLGRAQLRALVKS
ncbi:homing endonuclease [Erwinia phage Cronus]|uniref:HNH endonuclease n=1 Tax=Erwinia phage Cronus TaxID=2163633 RepID=A0A2S1GMI1_9CAUD|nr:homing endonuclease [Erwinia phage Cronus]AWD90586.1 HNH endonuclease [Erwinia phage Cronus]